MNGAQGEESEEKERKEEEGEERGEAGRRSGGELHGRRVHLITKEILIYSVFEMRYEKKKRREGEGRVGALVLERPLALPLICPPSTCALVTTAKPSEGRSWLGLVWAALGLGGAALGVVGVEGWDIDGRTEGRGLAHALPPMGLRSWERYYILWGNKSAKGNLRRELGSRGKEAGREAVAGRGSRLHRRRTS